MKKLLLITIAAAILLTGCGKKQQNAQVTNEPPATVTQSPTPENTSAPKPEEIKEKPESTPIGAEKAVEDLKKDKEDNYESEGTFLGITVENTAIIIEKSKGESPEIIRYNIGDGVDFNSIDVQSQIKFKFKVIDGKNTIIGFEKI